MKVSIPNQAETIVIGGGIVGVSVAYHLAREGREVILLERKQLTSGSTWHAAGLVSQFQGYPSVTKLAKYGIELMQSLEAQTGQATGFKSVGATAVALNEARAEELLRRKDVAVGQGIEVHSQSIEQLQCDWPLLNTDGVLEAIHFPNDGQTNPIDTTMALAKGARLAGARIFEYTSVSKLIVEQGRAVGVECSTEGGEKKQIQAENVVNCTGFWGKSFAAASGTHLPIQHNQHFYIVSDPIAQLTDPTPILRVYDEQAYYKEDAGKLLIGFAELNGMAWDPAKGIPSDFEFTELAYPEDHLMPVLEKCIERVPALGEVGIRTFFNGPEGYTPDGRYYLGEDQNIKQLFVAAGFNSSGIQNGPGAGKALADWIIKGHAPYDLVDVDSRRIHSFQSNRDYLLQRGPETLSETYAMHWPYKQRKTMRGLRRSPIHEQLKGLGAVFGEFAGWERPMWFAPSGVMAEYEYGYNETPWFQYWRQEHLAVRNEVGMSDLSPFCKILIEGEDAEQFLNWICTNNLAVAPGNVVYTQWLNERAGIEADVTVARLSDTQYLVMTSAVTGHNELTWLRKHKFRELNVAITDVSSSQAAFGITGPKARALLQAYANVDFSNKKFPFGSSQACCIGAVPVRAQRISYTGELGWELFFDASYAPYLFELLMSGEKAAAPKLFGLHAGESLRTEKAYRHWGHDIAYADTPLDAGLMFASKLAKPNGFLGREALIQKKEAGSSRTLVQFLLKGSKKFIYHNEPVYLGEQLVGAITTGTYGHSFDAPIGLGWVNLPTGVSLGDIDGLEFSILVAGIKVVAQASVKPLYDPTNERIRKF